jgi:chemotaxis protein methyltransferase CheR
MLSDQQLAITDQEFRQLRDFIHVHTGIALSEHKRALICARLAKRLRHHNLRTYAEYYALLTRADSEGNELMEMINAITTNKTDFFRESHHFEFLMTRAFPAFGQERRRLRLWSAGTATGEEAYSLAIALSESLPAIEERDVRILATDIDTQVLERARQGIYTLEQIAHLPEELRRRHFLKGAGEHLGQVRVKPSLQTLIRFLRLNLIEEPWPMYGPFDVIFCRNVLIYFDKPLQRRLLERFAGILRHGGYLMLGHAEFIHGLEQLYAQVGHSIYQCRKGH